MITAEDGHDVFRSRGVELHHCDHQTLAAVMAARGQKADAIVVDAPYSGRTHEANDVSAGRDPLSMEHPGKINRPLNYACWTEADVAGFVGLWSPRATGWLVSLTDHVLAWDWSETLDAAGRYSFSPIACVQSGSRIRLLGDGPAQWSTWAVVARPRDGAWLTDWRDKRSARGEVVSLPGAYVVPPGHSDRSPVIGGKPLWLMRSLVRDYSCPGGLVCDPCAGGGTTLLAAVMEGRQAIGSEPMREHFDIACRRLSEMPLDNPRTGQAALFR